jgi:cytochrome oxidase Cu insertion factor (SCO1/SenC/PrrC family)
VARGPLLLGVVREVWAQMYCGIRKGNATRMTGPAILLYNLERDGENAMDVNDKAPDFTLLDENEKPVSLKDFRGKTVILFFFPKADTPG